MTKVFDGCCFSSMRAIRNLSLDGVPKEILWEIFEWVCAEIPDFALLAVCQHTKLVLDYHPIVQIVKAFGVIRETHYRLSHLGEAGQPGALERVITLKQSSSQSASPFEQSNIAINILKKPWCKARFLLQMQLTMIRYCLAKRWLPLVHRDGEADLQPHENISWQWTKDLCNAVSLDSTAEHTSWCISSSRRAYPWSQVCIWPIRGRLIVRDRLMNESWEIEVPLFKTVAERIRSMALSNEMIHE